MVRGRLLVITVFGCQVIIYTPLNSGFDPFWPPRNPRFLSFFTVFKSASQPLRSPHIFWGAEPSIYLSSYDCHVVLTVPSRSSGFSRLPHDRRAVSPMGCCYCTGVHTLCTRRDDIIALIEQWFGVGRKMNGPQWPNGSGSVTGNYRIRLSGDYLYPFK